MVMSKKFAPLDIDDNDADLTVDGFVESATTALEGRRDTTVANVPAKKTKAAACPKKKDKVAIKKPAAADAPTKPHKAPKAASEVAWEVALNKIANVKT